MGCRGIEGLGRGWHVLRFGWMEGVKFKGGLFSYIWALGVHGFAALDIHTRLYV